MSDAVKDVLGIVGRIADKKWPVRPLDPIRCPTCGQSFMTWEVYMVHSASHRQKH